MYEWLSQQCAVYGSPGQCPTAGVQLVPAGRCCCAVSIRCPVVACRDWCCPWGLLCQGVFALALVNTCIIQEQCIPGGLVGRACVWLKSATAWMAHGVLLSLVLPHLDGSARSSRLQLKATKLPVGDSSRQLRPAPWARPAAFVGWLAACNTLPSSTVSTFMPACARFCSMSCSLDVCYLFVVGSSPKAWLR